LVGAFFAPLLASFILYYGSGWRPQGNTNHGELVQPVRQLPPTSLPLWEGNSTDPKFLQQKWSYVYLAPGECATECRQALERIRQVRLALAEKMVRVQRVFLYTGECCDQAYFTTEQAGLVIAKIDDPAGMSLLEQFPSYGATSALQAGRIYVVDPLGNLMMSYAADAPQKGMLEDMKRLLKLSHIG
jgi:hypothetical protein